VTKRRVAERERLPDVRPSITHKFKIQSDQGAHSCYLTVGFFDKGQKRPGEVFIRMGKQGSTLNGLLDTVGILISYGLQYGVSLADLCGKLKGMRFEPAGATSDSGIPKCTSIIDYVFAWLERNYVDV
jgi:ribonucleoside-diphosphate reductase alpha chain